MERIPQKILTPARINPNNEIKISQDTDVHMAIDFICDLLLNKKFDTIKICGLSNAIKKVVLITEIVKSKVKGLYQINQIDSLKGKKTINKIDDTETFDEDKFVPRMEILLTFIQPTEEEKKSLGYQEPSQQIIQGNINDIDEEENV